MEFKARIDTSQPLEKYFERQQLCQDLLKDTKEPIYEARMKHTVIDHLQQISHMVRNVRKYEQDEDIHETGSHMNLCNYFITREIEHIEDQTTVGQGEVANSAVTDGKLEYLQYEIGKSCHQKLRTRGCPGHHCRCYGAAKEGSR